MLKSSPQQVAVYDWILKDIGSLEVMARAGCGKTTTLMGAIQVIVKNALGNVAIMAYNKSIADELKEKLAEQGYNWKDVQAGTCHSFGLSAWRQVHKDIKIDEFKVNEIIKNLAALSEVDSSYEVYKECADVIEKWVSLGKQRAIGYLDRVEYDKVWSDLWDHFDLDMEVTGDWDYATLLAATRNVYQMSLNQCKDIVDFDDMILAPLVFKARFWPKDWVLLDESQDTNAARRALAMKMMKPRTGRMIFVGDPAQAIYGFTGADSDSMNQIKVALKAKTLPLSVTYRCPKAIVAKAQEVVPDIQAHDTNALGAVEYIDYKDMMDEALQSEDVILCRNTAPLIRTAYELLGKGIPCRVEGREIGSGLIKLATRWKINAVDKLLERLEKFFDEQKEKYIKKDQEEKVQALEDQVECLKIVISRCMAKGIHTVKGLVTEIESMFGNTKPGEVAKVLTLSTIHKSKGREWNRVFVLGNNKYLPSPYAKKDWQIQQERNLQYVADTRSKMELFHVAV